MSPQISIYCQLLWPDQFCVNSLPIADIVKSVLRLKVNNIFEVGKFIARERRSVFQLNIIFNSFHHLTLLVDII